MARTLTQVDLLRELEPIAAREVDRHLVAAKPWHPHDYVPWDEGRNFAAMGGVDWDPKQSKLSDLAKAAMVVNLLTEDNLPSYHRDIALAFTRESAWGVWVGRWTAEENRHGIVMRDYLVVTRGVDQVALENDRMTHMTNGFDPVLSIPPGTAELFVHTLVYVSFQELATRVSHRNTGMICGDPVAERMLQRIAADENLHMIFYRNLYEATFEAVPDLAMEALAAVVTNFQMPGAGMPNFRRNGVLMAKHGIYDLRQHLDEVIKPILRRWRVFDRTDLTCQGERAREELVAYLQDLETVRVPKFEDQRDRALARDRERGILV